MGNSKKIQSTENWWDTRSSLDTATKYRSYYDVAQDRVITYGYVEPCTGTTEKAPNTLSDEARRTRLLLRLGKNKVSYPFNVMFKKQTPKNQELIEECIEYADEIEYIDESLLFTFY